MTAAAGAAAATNGVKGRVHARLLAAPPGAPVGADGVARLVRDEAPLVGAGALRRLVEEVLAEVSGLGPLEPLLADPAVSEVMVNGLARHPCDQESPGQKAFRRTDPRRIAPGVPSPCH